MWMDDAIEQTRAEQVLDRLRALENPENRAGMARFGINTEHALGIAIPTLRKLAKELGRDHALALALWDSGIHEASILASMLDDSREVTSAQMDAWVRQFDSWDVCDQVCGNLFYKSPLAYDKALEWCQWEGEFERRAGFALIAALAVHDKRANDSAFVPFFGAIERHADDSRNFVKKSVNWALRQIGKRNRALNVQAMLCAQRLLVTNSTAARWTARDALKELSQHFTIS